MTSRDSHGVSSRTVAATTSMARRGLNDRDLLTSLSDRAPVQLVLQKIATVDIVTKSIHRFPVLVNTDRGPYQRNGLR